MRARPVKDRKSATFVGLVLGLVLALAPPAFAETQGGVTLSVSPIRHELSTEPGRTVEATMTVTNASEVALTLESSVRDFVADGEEGRPRFVPAEKSSWSMSSWIKTKPAKLKLEPGKKQEIAIRIEVPRKAEPGGHYAAVVFSSVPDAKGQTGLVAAVGTLLLLNVTGDIVEAGSGEVLSTRLTEPQPLELAVRFSNEGNVHVKPQGTLVLQPLLIGESTSFDVGGENVLPESSRVFTVSWENPPTFGIYRVNAAMTYGARSMTVETSRRFLVVMPWKLVLGGLGLFLLGILFSRVGRRRRGSVPKAIASAPSPTEPGAAIDQ